MSDEKLERSSRFRLKDFIIIVVFLSIAAVFVYLLADDFVRTVNLPEAYPSDLPVMKASLAVNMPPKTPQVGSAPAAEKPPIEKPPAEEPLTKEPPSVKKPIPAPQINPASAAVSSSTARSDPSPAVTPFRSQARFSPIMAANAPPSPPSSWNMLPSMGADFSLEELRSGKNITFSWAAVQGADAYIFYLYRQTASGQPQVVRTNLVYAPSYTMANSRALDSGAFIWKVEAVYIGRGNVIERSVTQGESTFTVNPI